MVVKPNTPAALDFLARLRPGGPWTLTVIAPDKKAIETKTLATQAEAEAFLNEWNGVRNIYFALNPLLSALNKKAERTDIAQVIGLHVDVDPRVGEDLIAERSRILGLFREKLPPGIPDPTIIIFSGGGYQGIWLLDTPIEINGDLEAAEDTKLYNKALELAFGGDNCHNIDRILRLPGTVNIPDAKKLKKGRQPELAEVVQFTDARSPLSAFSKAPKLIGPVAEFGAELLDIPGEGRRIEKIEELDEWGVPDRIKVIIVQGEHPNEPKLKDNSRSAWLFDAVCWMLRCQVPEDVVYGVITDPKWLVSGSVLDMKYPDRIRKYALRQIAKGKQYIIEPKLVELNEKYAVIESFGGQCLIVFEEKDPILGRSSLKKQTFDNFVRAKMNQQVQVGQDAKGAPKYAELGKWWVRHPQRRQYERVVYAPGREVPGAMNLWEGFSVEPRPGEKHHGYLHHMLHNICGGNEEHYAWLLNWMARAVRHPDEQGHVAIAIRGNRGTGKSLLVTEFGALFGRHFMHVSDPRHLVGNFNAHLRDTSVFFSDEAFFRGDKKQDQVLKALVTERTIPIEGKHVDVEMAPNVMHIFIVSNDEHFIRAAKDERRYFVLVASDAHKQDTGYFGQIVEDMRSGGRENLLHMLLNRDLTGWDPRTCPKTEALLDQADRTEDSVYRDFLAQALPDGDDTAAISAYEVKRPFEGRMGKNDIDDFSDAMRSLGWFPHNVRVPGSGKPTRHFVRQKLGGSNYTYYKAVKRPAVSPTGTDPDAMDSSWVWYYVLAEQKEHF